MTALQSNISHLMNINEWITHLLKGIIFNLTRKVKFKYIQRYTLKMNQKG